MKKFKLSYFIFFALFMVGLISFSMQVQAMKSDSVRQALSSVKWSTQNEIMPETKDLLTVVKNANTTKISYVPLSDSLENLINRMNINGVAIVTTEPQDTVVKTDSGNQEKVSITIYQLGKDGKPLPYEELKRVTSIHTNENNGGYNEYSVFGSLKVVVVWTNNGFKISSVSAKTIFGTQTVKTNRIHIRAKLETGFGFSSDEIKDKYINQPSNNTYYTLYPNFQNFASLQNMSDSLMAGAQFDLTNGHSFYLKTIVRGSDVHFFDDQIFYDTEIGEEE